MAAEPSDNAAAGSLERLLETGHQAARRFWWKLRARPRERTIARVKTEKERQRLTGLQYNEAPLVSVIVQSFNQIKNILTCFIEP